MRPDRIAWTVCFFIPRSRAPHAERARPCGGGDKLTQACTRAVAENAPGGAALNELKSKGLDAFTKAHDP
jgi:hypothetical protein